MTHRGVVLSYFENGGYGFVKDPITKKQWFYHITRSPDLVEITHIGMDVTFEVTISAVTFREEAVNLRNV
jgi:hypothetical protein